MKKILVFGGSHVSQVASAYWQLRTEKALPPDLKLDFISAPGPVLSRLRVTGSHLHLLDKPEQWPTLALPKEMFDGWHDSIASRLKELAGDGIDRVDLRSFEHNFFIGGQLLRDWEKVDRLIESQVFSSGCLMSVGSDLVQTSHFHYCLRDQDKTSADFRIVSSFEPIVSELSPDFLIATHKSGRLSRVTELLRCAAHTLGYEILPFPDELLNEDGNAVAARYHSGKENDFYHMNVLGGIRILHSMLATIDDNDKVL